MECCQISVLGRCCIPVRGQCTRVLQSLYVTQEGTCREPVLLHVQHLVNGTYRTCHNVCCMVRLFLTQLLRRQCEIVIQKLGGGFSFSPKKLTSIVFDRGICFCPYDMLVGSKAISEYMDNCLFHSDYLNLNLVIDFKRILKYMSNHWK